MKAGIKHDQELRLSSRTARAASRSGTYLSEYTERWVPALASLGRDDNSQSRLFEGWYKRTEEMMVWRNPLACLQSQSAC